MHTHVVGPQMKEHGRAFRRGDEEGARRIDEELEPAYELLKVAPNPIAIKAALNLLGHEVGGHRLPMVPATDDEVARVRDCLERAGLSAPRRGGVGPRQGPGIHSAGDRGVCA